MSRGLRSGARRICAMAGILLVGAALLATLAAWLVLRASLPALDGRATRSGVRASVRVNRDVDGVPSITAQNRGDLAFALGYLHAEDRFFQMDLLRRAAAGELAALLGPTLLPSDRGLRRHRFRDVARNAVASLDAPTRAVLDAYVNGANAGLRALHARPFEYWLLGVVPKSWTAGDTAARPGVVPATAGLARASPAAACIAPCRASRAAVALHRSRNTRVGCRHRR